MERSTGGQGPLALHFFKLLSSAELSPAYTQMYIRSYFEAVLLFMDMLARS